MQKMILSELTTTKSTNSKARSHSQCLRISLLDLKRLKRTKTGLTPKTLTITNSGAKKCMSKSKTTRNLKAPSPLRTNLLTRRLKCWKRPKKLSWQLKQLKWTLTPSHHSRSRKFPQRLWWSHAWTVLLILSSTTPMLLTSSEKLSLNVRINVGLKTWRRCIWIRFWDIALVRGRLLKRKWWNSLSKSLNGEPDNASKTIISR